MKAAAVKAIVVQYAVSRRGIPGTVSLRKWAKAALQRDGRSICIRIVGAAESRSLNSQWRGKDKSTNVLSFPLALTSRESRVASHQPLGDLVICAPVVAREAREQGKPLNAHWAHMVVHGVLHLRGYDHVKNRDAIRMEAREVEPLAGFGYQDPYVLQQGR